MTVAELSPISEAIKTFLKNVDPLTLDTTAEYRLSKNLRLCDQELKHAVESQQKLVVKYVKKDNKGNPVQVTVKSVDPETGVESEIPVPDRFELDNPKEYTEGLKKIREEKISDIAWMKVPLSLLVSAKGQKSQLFYYGDLFITDDTEVSE